MFFPVQATDKATVEAVTGIQHWAPGLYSFKTTRPEAYRFIAGQYARLGLSDANGNVIWRAYSIVSTPADPFLEFYLVDVPGGAFSALMRQLEIGDAILLDKQSFGFMTADRFNDGEELWMLATGTGLGPFVSILREPGVWEKFRHLILVHSVRQADEFAYQDEILSLKQQFSHLPAQFQLVQTTTRDTNARQEAGHLHGRITTLLNNGQLEQHVGLPLRVESSRIMLCGNPQMIEETRQILHQRGMRPARRATPGQFVAENYW